MLHQNLHVMNYIGQHMHTHKTQVLFSGSVSSSAEKFLLKLSPTGNWQ
jgi:hypothetical protein